MAVDEEKTKGGDKMNLWEKSVINIPKAICLTFGHNSKRWDLVPDRFLQNQFDPSGVHVLHSHYRPHARFSLLARYSPEKYIYDNCHCDRCHELIWEFYPVSLAGVPWGTPDEYKDRVDAMQFEHDFMGIDIWRIK